MHTINILFRCLWHIVINTYVVRHPWSTNNAAYCYHRWVSLRV